MKKTKILYSILRYVYVIGIIGFTLPYILAMTGGFLSYFFGINYITDYHQSFGSGEDGVLSASTLVWLAGRWIFLVALLVSIFFTKKKWFFIYVPAVVVIDAIFGLIMAGLGIVRLNLETILLVSRI